MYEVKILDNKKPIILLKWSGIVSRSEVLEVNDALDKSFKEIGRKKFYLLVDASELKVFAPDTKESIIEQQKRFVPHTISIASVIEKALISNQLKETREKAGNDKEKQFTSFNEALKYLKSL